MENSDQIPEENIELDQARISLAELEAKLESLSPENFEKLPEREKNLHRKAFVTNSGDPDYRRLTSLKYHDGETERSMNVPAGDLFHQFRKDVDEGKLPTVSWLEAPENLSDHPGVPWFGAWYVSEAQSPAVGLMIASPAETPALCIIKDVSYGKPVVRRDLRVGGQTIVTLDLTDSSAWHDFTVEIEGDVTFSRRYTGRVEAGKPGTTDPLIGRSIGRIAGGDASEKTPGQTN